jgi:hypothetical protein
MGRRVGDEAGGPSSSLLRYSSILLLVSAVGGFVVMAISRPEPVPITVTTTKESPLELHANGLGPVEIGIGFDKAVERGGLTVQRDDPSCSVATDPKSRATVVAKDGVVVLVSVQDPGVTTAEGIKVGSGSPEVEAAYRLGTDSGQVVVPEGENELVLGLYGGEVTFMWARRTGVSVGC